MGVRWWEGGKIRRSKVQGGFVLVRFGCDRVFGRSKRGGGQDGVRDGDRHLEFAMNVKE